MNVIISGSISNSFQLIGAIAAKNKFSDSLNTAVYLKISYHQYWNKKNISREVLEIIENDFPIIKETEPLRTIHLSINNPRILKKNQIIIDDGVAAYRKNPFALLKAINNERKIKNTPPFSIKESIEYILIQSLKMLYSTIHPGHISIFKKTIFDYFEPSEENKKHFLKAIAQISNRLNEEYFKENKKIILFLSQPYKLFGFKKPKDYENFIKRVIIHFKKENPNAIFVIKKHPIDDFDYLGVEAQISTDNNLPAEIYFYRNKENIIQTIGFNSTSLLTGKILFDIPGFYIERRDSPSITGDFWVDRGFKKHLSPLRLSC